MTIADSEQIITKGKLIIYIGVFVELYNQKNHEQVYEIHEIIKFESWRTSIAWNSCILGAYYFIKIFLVLRSSHVVPRDQEKTVFYINNYTDWD